MKVTLWPTKTSSSMATPSQMKVWLEILQFFRRKRSSDLYKGSDLGVIPTEQP